MMAQPISLYGKYFNVEALAHYLLSRRNPDGGFCFYSLDESSLNDTFFASLILAILGRTPTDGQTIRYIQSFQGEDGGFSSVYSAWCVLKALKVLESSPLRDPGVYLTKCLASHRIPDEVYIERLSIFETSYYLTDALSMAGHEAQCKTIADKVKGYSLADGSFGRCRSSLMDTYFALAILDIAGIPINEPEKVYKYVTSRAVRSGGFSKTPQTGLAFMDETYFAIMTLELLDKKPGNVRETIDFIVDCQNENGGFRRARASGISGFDTSYYALESLRALIKS